ncbi:hypothetical protein MMC13_006241 [Lambiella insularis]|nr:hypothetical protein [Lambiella insularis]
MTSNPPISLLPPELLALIFSSLDSLSDLAHLLSVSRTFRLVLHSHAHPIYHAVAPRSTPAFPSASALLETQESHLPSPPHDPNATALSRIPRLALYAHLASQTCSVVAKLRATRLESHGPPLPHERARFFHGFYLMFRLACTPLSQLRPLLAATPPPDLHRLLCVSTWATHVLGAGAAAGGCFVRGDWRAVEQAIRAHFVMRNVRIGGRAAAGMGVANCFTMFEEWGEGGGVYWRGEGWEEGERAARGRERRWRKRMEGR